jgi:hypothetical protein
LFIKNCLKLKILKIVPDPDNYTVILRFFGTTPNSSNMTNVFISLINQLAKIFDLNLTEELRSNEKSLKEYLLNLLLTIHEKYPNRKIVFVLDSIDQLHPSNYSLGWFPYELPPNTKIIFSTLPNHGEILANLKKEQNLLEEANFVKIESLNSDLAKTIIQDWLKKSQRALSEQQWTVLDKVFASNTLYPLYVKLLFDIVSKWPSFYEPEKEFIDAKTIDKCIMYLFLILEKTHGKLLFSRSIIYMSSFRNGISENEIEDILSLDDDVLYDIFEFHAPPVSVDL